MAPDSPMKARKPGRRTGLIKLKNYILIVKQKGAPFWVAFKPLYRVRVESCFWFKDDPVQKNEMTDPISYFLTNYL